MTKRNYMKRLYLLAKWCLPEEEAKEVIRESIKRWNER